MAACENCRRDTAHDTIPAQQIGTYPHTRLHRLRILRLGRTYRGDRMNWYAVRVVFLVAICVAFVLAFAVTMATAEYGTWREALTFASITFGLLVAGALLWGSVA